MKGSDRRKQIIQILLNTNNAVSGGALAKQLNVSRQVIVQDMALLRAENNEIISTTRGYMITKEQKKNQRIIYVKHTIDQMEDELNLIVDCGGRILDVMVEHPVYGVLKASLNIGNRQEVGDFMRKVGNSETVPLKELTKDIHRHTIEANTEEILDAIEENLKREGYLYEEDFDRK